MAHIIAAKDGGPRSNPELSREERGAFENLVVLCANCHTMVDKAPDAFPDSMILGWKREHANKLQGLFGAVRFDDRTAARQVVAPLLAENLAIFQQYGPHIEAASNPESGAAEQWKRKMLTRILPNNRRVLAVLDANRHLLAMAKSWLLSDSANTLTTLRHSTLRGTDRMLLASLTFYPRFWRANAWAV